MLLLPLLALAAYLFCFLSFFLDGQAQVLLKQRQVSVTKGHKTTTSVDCIAEDIPDFQSAYIHWYRQVPSKAPEWILYIGPGAVSYNDNSYSNKYSSLKEGTNICTFTISIYFVALQNLYFWLCIYLLYTIDLQNLCFSNFLPPIIHLEKGSSPPANSEILQKKHENQIIYVCLIEKFYPEVIRVTWTDDEKEVTDNVVKGDTWQSTKEDEYSIASWLTVPAENKDKKYYCKYEHEEEKASLHLCS
uniref:Uncharacterized protein n=1 Tax=Corvus moneduloides TaxID=1196302 RepID=A0A8C3ENH1_CORMO